MVWLTIARTVGVHTIKYRPISTARQKLALRWEASLLCVSYTHDSLRFQRSSYTELNVESGYKKTRGRLNGFLWLSK